MSTQVTRLSKCFETSGTSKRPLSSVFSEVISQVATLLECGIAARMSTFKIKLDPLSLRVFNSNCLVPLFGYTFKSFTLNLTFMFIRTLGQLRRTMYTLVFRSSWLFEGFLVFIWTWFVWFVVHIILRLVFLHFLVYWIIGKRFLLIGFWWSLLLT